jgi:hypothetical protein
MRQTQLQLQNARFILQLREMLWDFGVITDAELILQRYAHKDVWKKCEYVSLLQSICSYLDSR